MLNPTNLLGQLTELWCQIHFCERGIILSQPTNPSSRYDFIADINGKLYRIQCKTSCLLSNNRIQFSTKSKNWNSGEYHSYLNDVDYFYTCWNQIGYLIPINLVNETTKSKILRLGDPKDYTQSTNSVLYAKYFEIDEILTSLGINYEKTTIESRNKINHCKRCGKQISTGSNYCVNCANRKHDVPTRDELKNLIRVETFTSIGGRYDVTDNAVKKWCDKYNLPKKKSDINKLSDDDWKLV